MSLVDNITPASDPTTKDPSIRTRVYQFDKPNHHPVFFTGLYPVRVRFLFNDTATTEKLPEDEQPKDPWRKYSQAHYFEPVQIEPPLSLPNNWGPSVAVPAGQTLKAYDVLFVTIPKQFLRSHNSLEFNMDQDSVYVYHAWTYIIKSVMRSAEGSKSERVSDRHYFHRPEDAKQGLEERFPAKVQVFGEVMMRGWRPILADTAEDQYPGKTPDQVDWQTIVTEVGFRRRMVSKENFLGVRFIFVATDPKVNFGRALQHRQWKNEIMTGKASGLEIKTRHDIICANWRRKMREALKERPSSSEQQQPPQASLSASSSSVDRYDLGPELEAEKGESLAQKEQADEEERVLGDEEPEPEPAGENIGGDKAPPGAAGGGGNRQNQQQQDNERQKEAKRKAEVEAALGALGIKIPDRDPKAYTYRNNYLRKQQYQQQLAKSGKQVSRFAAPVSTGSKEEDARQYMSTLEPKDWYRSLVTSQDDLVRLVYSTLLGPNATSGLTADQLRNECQDLGDFKNPLNPRNFFTFRRSADIIAETMNIAPCPEQADEANYIDTVTGELKFPIPFAVWRFPEGEFRLKNLERSKAFWHFSAFEEQLVATERKAVDRQEQRHLRAYGLSARQHDERPRNFEEEEILRSGSGRYLGDLNEELDEPESVEEDVTHQVYIESEERRMVMNNKLASSSKPSKRLSSRYGESAKAREVFMRGLARRAAEMGIQDPNERAQREREEHVVTDLIGNDIKDANQLYRRVMAACTNVPEDAALLIKLFREHQEEVYKSRMRPGVKGVNEVFAMHAACLNRKNTKENIVTFKYTGYKNLTFAGSLIAEFLLRARVQFGLTNSHHILLMALWNASPNAYRASRRLGLHLLKAGPPGIGKSYVDKYIKCGKADGTVMESIHNSNLSKFVEQCTDDRFYMEDEASWATVGDSSRAKSSQEHQQITLMKAWLSNDLISFTVLDYDSNGTRFQKRKVVSARGIHSVNVNVLANNKDTANYDRYWIYHIMPWYSPIRGQTDLFRFGEASELESWTEGYLWDLKKLDNINYRMAKLVDYRAAAQPNIIDFTLHMAKGMAKLSRYGITSDCQNRTMQKACEMATTMTMTAAVLQHFSGPWSPTIEEDIINGRPVERPVPWSEDMLKRARYRLFMTEDIKFYVLSAVYRQILKDYPPWDVLQFVARAMLGFTSSYFKDLFDKDAWEEREVEEKQPDGSVKKVTKRKQKFPFTSLEKMLKKRDGKYENLPDYIKDEDLMLMRFELRGMQSRYGDSQSPYRQHLLPAFYCYKESSTAVSAEDLRKAQEEKAARAAGAENLDQEPRERTLPDTVDPALQDGGARAAAAYGFTQRPSNTKAKPQGSYGRDNKAQETPAKRVINPNWIVFPYSLQALSARVAVDLGANAHTQPLCIENMLHHLAKKTLMVPELENMSEFNEKPRFAYRTTEDGKREIKRVTTHILKEEYCQYVHHDEAMGKQHSTTKRVFISTMALMCFQPMRGLFEFLTAMEYNHTMPMNAVIELPIRGYEGLHYIHQSQPNPKKVLRKRVCKELGSTVIRSLFMEHTTAVFARMPGMEKVVDPELDREKIRKHLERIRAEDAEGSREWMTPEVASKTKELLGKSAKNKSMDELVEEEFQRRKQAKEDSRTHISANSQYSQLLRGLATEMSREEQVYQRYHIFEEYEKWMKEEYGKVIKLDAQGRSDKIYYPMVMSQRIIPAYVENSPYYSATRKGFNGELVQYPNQILDEFRLVDMQYSKSHGQEPGAYLLQARITCEKKIANYLKQLRLIRDPMDRRGAEEDDDEFGHLDPEERKKARKRLNRELAEKMGYSAGEDSSSQEDSASSKRPGTYKSMLGRKESDKSGDDDDSEEEDFRKATQAKRAKKDKEKKSSKKDSDSEKDKSESRKKKKRGKGDAESSESESESDDDKRRKKKAPKNVQALLPDLLANDPKKKAKVVRRDKPGFNS